MERKKLFQLLCLVTFLIPDNFFRNRKLGSKPNNFFNLWSLISFIALCISIHHCYSEFSQVLLAKPPPNNLKPKSFIPDPNNRKVIGEDISDSEPPQIPPADESESVVHLSNVLPHLISCTIALFFRFAIWFNFSSFRHSKQAFINFKVSPEELCLNEYIAFGFILLSLVPRHFELWCDNNGYGGFPGLQNSSIWFQLLSHLKCFIGESFPIFASGVALISFVEIITNSILKQTKLLDVEHAEVAWSIANFKTIEELNDLKSKSFPALRIEIMPIQNVNVVVRNIQPSIHRLDGIEKKYMSCVTLWNTMQNKTALITLLLYLELTMSLSFKSFLAVSRYISTKETNITVNDQLIKLDQEGQSDWRTLNAVASTFINVAIGLSVTHSVHVLHITIEKFKIKLLKLAWSKKFSENFNSTRNNIVSEQLISYLLHTLGQNPINLSAFGYFTVKRSTLTSLAGVILTYLVVLIQFQTT